MEVLVGKFARRLAKYSETDKEEIYTYGLEVIISTVIGVASILLESYLLSSFVSGLVFLAVFVPLRLFTGGYHAKTYGKCYFISNLSYVFVLFVRYIISDKFPSEIWACLLLCICFYIIKKAPIVNPAQPISDKKQRRSKRITKGILMVDIVWIVCLYFYKSDLMIMAILSICLVFILMLISPRLI